MTTTTTSATTALTPPRGKVHRVSPNHGAKAHYVNRSNESHTENNDTKNNKRNHQPTNKKSKEVSNKRLNSNPTPRKGSETNKDDSSCASSADQKSRSGELLDPTDPQQAHRIRQRQKMIAKGKNTSGYARYRSLVPLNERKSKSLATPSTPNPYHEMSTKRWQGLVRAWRIALHQYDPPELVQTLQPPSLPMVPDIDKDQGNAGDDEKEHLAASDSVFMECQTPNTKKGKHAPTSPSEDRIVIRDAEQADDDLSPCVSVISRTSPAGKINQKGVRRDLEALFAESSGIELLCRFDEEEIEFVHENDNSQHDASLNPSQLKGTAGQQKRCYLRTGQKCWGDESSDEDDDLL